MVKQPFNDRCVILVSVFILRLRVGKDFMHFGEERRFVSESL